MVSGSKVSSTLETRDGSCQWLWSDVKMSKRWIQGRKGDVKKMNFWERGLSEDWAPLAAWELEKLVMGNPDEVCWVCERLLISLLYHTLKCDSDDGGCVVRSVSWALISNKQERCQSLSSPYDLSFIGQSGVFRSFCLRHKARQAYNLSSTSQASNVNRLSRYQGGSTESVYAWTVL